LEEKNNIDKSGMTFRVIGDDDGLEKIRR